MISLILKYKSLTKLKKLKTIKSRIDDIIAVQVEEVCFKIYMIMKMTDNRNEDGKVLKLVMTIRMVGAY